jgi:putative two-component system response regulator
MAVSDACDMHGQHGSQVSELAQAIALDLGLSISASARLAWAARLHDVGKLDVPCDALAHPGPLDEAQREAIQQHPRSGFAMLWRRDSPELRLAAVVALTHHERWDGAGYPLRLAGEEIPLGGRIVAIADVFDALVSERPYKPAWSRPAATMEILAGRGTQFDPAVVDGFARVVRYSPAASEVALAEGDELGVERFARDLGRHGLAAHPSDRDECLTTYARRACPLTFAS